jgi:hypothetical protein
MLRIFHLERLQDVSKVSGVGRVGEGVVFVDTGEVVLHWFGDNPSINIYHSIEAVEKVHGHNGSTLIVFDDGKPAPRAN